MKDSDTDTASNPEFESGEGPEQVEELVTPKSTGPKTPVRDPTDTVSSIDETKDDTVVRSKQTQTPTHIKTTKKSDYITTIATPASPWQLPTIPDHTGHTPPPIPTPLKQDLRDPPKYPPRSRDPFILDPIKKINPIQDPSFKFTQTDPEPKSKLKGKAQPLKRKSSEPLGILNILLPRNTFLLVSHNLVNKIQVNLHLPQLKVPHLNHQNPRNQTHWTC